jgi:hypothetical protein
MGKRHCCQDTERNVAFTCEAHQSRFDGPDALVDYDPRFDEYGLIIDDGGSSVLAIKFCPWCGDRLPASKRDLWFDALSSRGLDPYEDPLPPEYLTDEWWRT